MTNSVKVATLKANGSQFIVNKIDKGKVYCKGSVMRVNGASAKHGPDRVFILERVDIREVDYTPELLEELLEITLG